MRRTKDVTRTCDLKCAISACTQAPLEASLTEEEARRNSRRLDLLYLASSHPVAPDVFQLADQAASCGADEAARATLERSLDPQLCGAPPHVPGCFGFGRVASQAPLSVSCPASSSWPTRLPCWTMWLRAQHRSGSRPPVFWCAILQACM